MTADGASCWTSFRCGAYTVASMADQGLLLVPRREACFGVGPSAETNGKDVGLWLCGQVLKRKDRLFPYCSRESAFLSFPQALIETLSLYVCIFAFFAFSCTFPLLIWLLWIKQTCWPLCLVQAKHLPIMCHTFYMEINNPSGQRSCISLWEGSLGKTSAFVLGSRCS